MIDTLSFPGVFFCPCGRLEAVFRAAMGNSPAYATKRPGDTLKTPCTPALIVRITSLLPFSVPAASPAARYSLHSA